MLRGVLGGAWGVLTTMLASTVSLLVFPISPGGRLGARIARWWSKLLLWSLRIPVRVTCDPSVREGTGYIVVANHSSLLDINALAAALPIEFHFVSRPFFFKMPFLGWGMWAGRHVALDPKNPRQAARALRGLGPRFERGLSVLLFPEGTRSPDGRVRGYKRGAISAAIHLGVPIVPAYVRGTAQCLPKKSLWLRGGTIEVTVGAAIPTGNEDARELTKRVEQWTREQEAKADRREPGAEHRRPEAG